MKIPIKMIALVPLFTALTAAGAFVKIPFPLAPMTLQTTFVLMAGFLLGPVYGALSQAIYIAVGLAGIPVFASGGGLGYVLNPTFGFLAGFVLMAYVCGMVYRKHPTITGALIGGLLGYVCCYAIGLPYLYLIFNLHLDMQRTFSQVAYGAMLIFLPGDLFKLGAAAVLCGRILKRLPLQVS